MKRLLPYILLSCLLVAPITLRAGEPPAPAIAAAPEFSIPMIELRGSGTEMGKAQGQQLGETIRSLNDGYLKRFMTGETQRFAARAAAMLFEDKLAPEHQ